MERRAFGAALILAAIGACANADRVAVNGSVLEPELLLEQDLSPLASVGPSICRVGGDTAVVIDLERRHVVKVSVRTGAQSVAVRHGAGPGETLGPLSVNCAGPQLLIADSYKRALLVNDGTSFVALPLSGLPTAVMTVDDRIAVISSMPTANHVSIATMSDQRAIVIVDSVSISTPRNVLLDFVSGSDSIRLVSPVSGAFWSQLRDTATGQWPMMAEISRVMDDEEIEEMSGSLRKALGKQPGAALAISEYEQLLRSRPRPVSQAGGVFACGRRTICMVRQSSDEQRTLVERAVMTDRGSLVGKDVFALRGRVRAAIWNADTLTVLHGGRGDKVYVGLYKLKETT